MKQTFTPSEEILAKYAKLIVKFGMQSRDGKKLKKGSVNKFTVPEVAKPLYFHLQAAILKRASYKDLFVYKNDISFIESELKIVTKSN